MQPMSIDEFVEYLSSDLADFKENWEEQRQKFPDQFPAKMAEGDWFEQFLFYIEHKDMGNDDPPCRQS